MLTYDDNQKATKAHCRLAFSAQPQRFFLPLLVGQHGSTDTTARKSAIIEGKMFGRSCTLPSTLIFSAKMFARLTVTVSFYLYLYLQPREKFLFQTVGYVSCSLELAPQKRRSKEARMFFSLIYFFAPFSIFYIPHNYVISQTMPHAIPQSHSAFYPHRNFNMKTYGQRAFSVAAPRLWNKLPFEIRACSDVNLFKSKLKTFLFKKAYDI